MGPAVAPSTGATPPTIAWADGAVEVLDQRALPALVTVVRAATVDELCELISSLAVRGAPALGIAGALGVALAAHLGEDPVTAGERLVATRPTAVNLRGGVARALAADDPLAEALAMLHQDTLANTAIARHGAALVPPGAAALTHCNTGPLACGAVGTALGVLIEAHRQGRLAHVWVDETRPLLQGARLTTWELAVAGVPHTLLVDAAAGGLLATGRVDLVIVGADRVAANGDVANKVGTYPLAVLAARHGVPFYVALPSSTIDPATADGASIEIEQRAADEVRAVAGAAIAPPSTAVWNPAFDVTPAELVRGYVTELGVLDRAGLARWTDGQAVGSG